MIQGVSSTIGFVGNVMTVDNVVRRVTDDRHNLRTLNAEDAVLVCTHGGLMATEIAADVAETVTKRVVQLDKTLGVSHTAKQGVNRVLNYVDQTKKEFHDANGYEIAESVQFTCDTVAKGTSEINDHFQITNTIKNKCEQGVNKICTINETYHLTDNVHLASKNIALTVKDIDQHYEFSENVKNKIVAMDETYAISKTSKNVMNISKDAVLEINERYQICDTVINFDEQYEVTNTAKKYCDKFYVTDAASYGYDQANSVWNNLWSLVDEEESVPENGPIENES